MYPLITLGHVSAPWGTVLDVTQRTSNVGRLTVGHIQAAGMLIKKPLLVEGLFPLDPIEHCEKSSDW
jgi:hypothetical protein